MKECECPTDHTITKLGHCRTCPYYRHAIVEVPPRYAMTQTLSVFVCNPHISNHTHDFDWATYSDEIESYGVCQCGFNSFFDMLWNGP